MRKGIFQIDRQALKKILGLPDEADILDMMIADRHEFSVNEEIDPILKVKLKWDGLPLEVREGTKIPSYDLIASGDKKDCGHTEMDACLFFSDDIKSECWRMK